MPAHDKALARKDEQIRDAIERGDQKAVDHYLDQRNRMVMLATNWDADRWGLNPDAPLWDDGGRCPERAYGHCDCWWEHDRCCACEARR